MSRTNIRKKYYEALYALDGHKRQRRVEKLERKIKDNREEIKDKNEEIKDKNEEIKLILAIRNDIRETKKQPWQMVVLILSVTMNLAGLFGHFFGFSLITFLMGLSIMFLYVLYRHLSYPVRR